MKNKLNGKTILVSGGTGSIGSVLVEQLLKNFSPKQVRIFDNHEVGLFEAIRKYPNNRKLRFFLGDVRDKNRVTTALEGVDIAFHAAALKHVNLNEYSPFESVKTNVIGTQNMLEAALENKIEVFINVSTDKAANPTSTMGASKLLAERLTTGMEYYKGRQKTIFASVRFGNVLNSSGSVMPIFLDQIENGGPVTVTDKRMVRYFMTTEEAVKLIFKATNTACGGEVFILKMPALKIWDLAEAMISKFSQKKLTIKEVGKRPGEKLFEKIVTRTEAEQALELKEMYVLPIAIDFPNKDEDAVNQSYQYYQKLGGKPVPSDGVKPEKLLNKQQVRKLIDAIN